MLWLKRLVVTALECACSLTHWLDQRWGTGVWVWVEKEGVGDGFPVNVNFGYGFVVPADFVAAWELAHGGEPFDVEFLLESFPLLSFSVAPARGVSIAPAHGFSVSPARGGVPGVGFTYVVFADELVSRYAGAGVWNIDDETDRWGVLRFSDESYRQLDAAADVFGVRPEFFDWYVVVS